MNKESLLRVIQTRIISFLRSISERNVSDIKWLWISMTSYSIDFEYKEIWVINDNLSSKIQSRPMSDPTFSVIDFKNYLDLDHPYFKINAEKYINSMNFVSSFFAGLLGHLFHIFFHGLSENFDTFNQPFAWNRTWAIDKCLILISKIFVNTVWVSRDEITGEQNSYESLLIFHSRFHDFWLGL